jgi:simple sugar transport system permease protein
MPAHTPWPIALPVAIAAAALGGALLGALAGWLRGRFGTHEVISTLMLNGLAAVLTTWLYGGPLRVGEQVHTRLVVPGARLPLAGTLVRALRGSGLNVAFVLAVLAAAATGYYLKYTRRGLALRALGSSSGAAEALGVPVARTMTRAMALSGALAGLVGVHYVLGVKGFAEQGMGVGVGFVGIAVALLGNLRPAGIVLAALLFGALSQGGLVVNAIVPSDVLAVAQAATIVAVAALGGAALKARSA